MLILSGGMGQPPRDDVDPVPLPNVCAKGCCKLRQGAQQNGAPDAFSVHGYRLPAARFFVGRAPLYYAGRNKY